MSKPKLPPKGEIVRLLKALKADICDDYRCSDDPDDKLPGMCVTIGASVDGSWHYQTGDNSFTGGAYGHRHWAVVYLYRRSDSIALAQDALNELADGFANEVNA